VESDATVTAVKSWVEIVCEHYEQEQLALMLKRWSPRMKLSVSIGKHSCNTCSATFGIHLADPTLALGPLRIPDQKRPHYELHQTTDHGLEGEVGHSKERNLRPNRAK
jgi:hypothetical protein